MNRLFVSVSTTIFPYSRTGHLAIFLGDTTLYNAPISYEQAVKAMVSLHKHYGVLPKLESNWYNRFISCKEVSCLIDPNDNVKLR